VSITKDVITYNLDDSKLFPLTADPSGGSPSYGTGIDIPGIQSHTAQAEVINAELKGDAKMLDIYSKVEKFSGSVKHGVMSFDALETLLGGTVSETGTSPNERKSFKMTGASLPGYFKLETQIKYVGGEECGLGADFHVVLYKVKVTGLSVEYANESHASVSFDYMAIPLNSNDEMVEFVKNETAVAINAGSPDTTPPTVASSTPADEDASVAVDATINFVFSEDMRLDTVSDAGCYVLMSDAGVAKAFTVAYSQSTKTATLTPTTALANSTNYIAAVTRMAQDLAGNRIAAQHVINFTTVGP
jgi:hypothetical protein